MVRFTITIMAKCSGAIPKAAEMGAKVGTSCFIIQRDLGLLSVCGQHAACPCDLIKSEVGLHQKTLPQQRFCIVKIHIG
jgi:hypothetical protein